MALANQISRGDFNITRKAHRPSIKYRTDVRRSGLVQSLGEIIRIAKHWKSPRDACQFRRSA